MYVKMISSCEMILKICLPAFVILIEIYCFTVNDIVHITQSITCYNLIPNSKMMCVLNQTNMALCYT